MDRKSSGILLRVEKKEKGYKKRGVQRVGGQREISNEIVTILSGISHLAFHTQKHRYKHPHS